MCDSGRPRSVKAYARYSQCWIPNRPLRLGKCADVAALGRPLPTRWRPSHLWPPVPVCQRHVGKRCRPSSLRTPEINFSRWPKSCSTSQTFIACCVRAPEPAKVESNLNSGCKRQRRKENHLQKYLNSRSASAHDPQEAVRPGQAAEHATSSRLRLRLPACRAPFRASPIPAMLA